MPAAFARRARAPRLVGLVAVALAVLVAPSGATAAAPPAGGPAPLPERDVAAGKRVGATGRTERSRAALERGLGGDAAVTSTPDTGALRLLQRTDGLLTGPSRKAPVAIATDYVRAHETVFGLDASDRAALDRTAQSTSPDGLTHVTWQQTVEGVPAYGTGLRAHLTGDGRLVSFSGDPIPGLTLDTTTPALDAAAARAAAAGFVRGDVAQARSPRLVAFPVGDRARLAWDVTAGGAPPYEYDVVVDATSGALLRRHAITEFANAQVWGRQPGATSTVDLARTVGGSAWLDDTAGGTRLFGNNAHVYSDLNNNDADDAATEDVPSSGGGDWLYPQTGLAAGASPCPVANGCSWDSGSPGSYATNREQNATQVFYYVNTFHDHLAAPPIGFDAASGNFQADGGDPVLAEPDDSVAAVPPDGPTYNNANMSTPADGTPPRMQMYLFKSPFNAVNGGDVADIVYHEYTHGLSGRLTTGLDNVEGRAMGEGWSDWYAFDLLNDQGLAPDTAASGELDAGQPTIGGNHLIRWEALDCAVGAPASLCPGSPTAGPGGFTYGDVGRIEGANRYEVHADGEVWAQTLWDLRAVVGSDVAEALITGGMRLSPNAPKFLDERDAILQEDAAAYGGVHARAIWSVFAARGMGYAASFGTEDFTIPPDIDDARAAGVDDAAPLGNGNGFLEPGEAARLTLAARNLFAPLADPVATLTSTDESSAVVTRGATSFPAPWTGDAQTTTPVSVAVPAATPCGAVLPLRLGVGSATADPRLVVGALGAPVATSSGDVPKTIVDANASEEPTLSTSSLTLPAGTLTPPGLRVTLSIDHSWDSDLVVVLTHAGRTATLTDSRGDDGDDFSSTVFADDAASPIAAGTAPFTGAYRPETPLSVFAGTPVAGAWTLRMTDQGHGDEGTLTAWSIDVPSRTCAAPAHALPVAATGEATSVTATTAHLGGTVDPRGTDTAAGLDVGVAGTEATLDGGAVGAGFGAVAIGADVTGLAPSTTYRYRALALRAGTPIAVGPFRTFTTAVPPPVVTVPPNPGPSTTSTTPLGTVTTPAPRPRPPARSIKPKITFTAKRGGKRVTLRLKVGGLDAAKGRIAVRATLLRRRTTVASSASATVRSGRASLTLKAKRTIPKGSYTLTIRVTQGSASQTTKRTVRLR